MQKWLLKILVCAVNVFILAYIFPVFLLKICLLAVIVAVVLSLLDGFVKPLLILLCLKTILTLGFFFL